jgi:hypothetical protein
MREYSSKRHKQKSARLLAKVSSRILYYGNVLDMISQHHPEYVALAWGSAKFVLMVCTCYPHLPRIEQLIRITGNH